MTATTTAPERPILLDHYAPEFLGYGSDGSQHYLVEFVIGGTRTVRVPADCSAADIRTRGTVTD